MSKLFQSKYIPYYTFLLVLGIVFSFYHDIFLEPNNFLFSSTGDGIKNYYTYLFHANYGENFTEFNGMNYPYGEHITYTDGHPFLTNVIRVFGLGNYGVGILNMIILLSFPLCAFFLNKILLHFKSQKWISVLAAVAITLLTPQIFRINGHYSLSYSFAIPLVWWLLIRINETRKWIFSISLFTFVLITLFTHPYLGLINILFAFVWGLIVWLTNRKDYRVLLQTFFHSVLPVVVFKVLINLTDTHVNRTDNPGGFFTNHGNWTAILSPYQGPLDKFYRNILHFDAINWETSVYIGSGVTILAIVTLIVVLVKIKSYDVKSFLKSKSFLFFVTAFIILIFSFCIPFKYNWVKPLLEYIKPIKQFRALARFGWLFYYVFTILVVVWFFKLKTKNRIWQYLLFIICMGLSIYEAIPLHRKKARQMTEQNNIFKVENLSNSQQELIHSLKELKPDAFMFLPVTHLSSESIYLIGDQQSEFDSQWISYHLNLPMLNSATSRMSLDEAYKFNNLFSPSYIQKDYLNDIPKNDRIVIITNGKGLRPFENQFLENCKLISKVNEFSLYEFNKNQYYKKKDFEKIKREYDSTIQISDDWKASDSVKWFYYDGFEDSTTNSHFYSNGAFEGIKHDWNVIKTIKSDEIPIGKYKLSFWYNLDEGRPAVDANIKQRYKEHDKWQAKLVIANSTHIVENWCFVELDVDITDDTEQFDLLLTTGGNNEPYMIDELLIRPIDVDFYKKARISEKEYLIFNNFVL